MLSSCGVPSAAVPSAWTPGEEKGPAAQATADFGAGEGWYATCGRAGQLPKRGGAPLLTWPLVAGVCVLGILTPSEAQAREAALPSITPQSRVLPALPCSIQKGTLSQGGPARGAEDLAGPDSSRSVRVTRLGLCKQLSSALGTARRDISDLTDQEEPFLGLLLVLRGKSPFTGVPGCWDSL